MITYDPNKTWHPQTVRLTLAQWRYKKEIEITVGGNCFGFTVMESAVSSAFDHLDIRTAFGREIAFVELVDDEGDTLLCHDDEGKEEDWFRSMIVAVEIIGQADTADID